MSCLNTTMDSVRKARLEQEHGNWDSTWVRRRKAAKLDRQLVRQLPYLTNHVQNPRLGFWAFGISSWPPSFRKVTTPLICSPTGGYERSFTIRNTLHRARLAPYISSTKHLKVVNTIPWPEVAQTAYNCTKECFACGQSWSPSWHTLKAARQHKWI